MVKKVDISKLAARLNELNEHSNRDRNGSLNFLSIKDGRNVIRILPPTDNMESFGEEVWVHYGVGKSEKNKRGSMVVCPTTHGEDNPCPVCEAVKELYALSLNRDDEYSKQARSLGRKRRIYYNAISRDEDLSEYELREEDGKKVWYNKKEGKQESPVKVLATGIGVYKAIISLIVDPEYGDVTDPEEGLDLIITKTGSGQFNTNYDVKTVRKESPIGLDGWEAGLNDLKLLTKSKTYSEIAKILDGAHESHEDENGDLHEDVNSAMDSLPDKTPNESEADLEAEIQAAIRRKQNK